MAELKSQRDVEAWVNARPEATRQRDAVVLASRAALRALPFLGIRNKRGQHASSTLTNASFRAIVASRFFALVPNRDAQAAAYAADAARAAAYAAAYAAADAAADAADAARAAADAAAWKEISRDAAMIEKLGAEAAMRSPLRTESWPDALAQNHWRDLRKELLSRNEDHEVWIDWYERILDGRSASREVEEATVFLDDPELWKDPAKANAAIRERLEGIKERERDKAKTHDFFISYNKNDELYAREISKYLEEAGFTTYVQFKDFGPGSNFVREMQFGLKASSRFVALYSPDYEKSEHCQAEWASAYREDPSGEKRKILGFLLSPTELNELAQQVIYTSLIGLEPSARRKAVIDAVNYKPQPRTKNELSQELAAKASPDVEITDKGEVDAVANASLDKPYLDPDLQNLIDTQIEICKIIIASLEGQAEKATLLASTSYHNHLSAKRERFITGLLEQLAAPLVAGRANPHFANGDIGLPPLIDSFYNNHVKLTTYHTRKQERDRLYSETIVNDEAATGNTLNQIFRDVDAAIKPVAEADQATAEFVKTHEALKNQAERLSAQNPPNEKPADNIVTPKRRLVLTTIAFYERLYNAVGSTASIVGTETGKALLVALEKARTVLWGFVTGL